MSGVYQLCGDMQFFGFLGSFVFSSKYISRCGYFSGRFTMSVMRHAIICSSRLLSQKFGTLSIPGDFIFLDVFPFLQSVFCFLFLYPISNFIVTLLLLSSLLL